MCGSHSTTTNQCRPIIVIFTTIASEKGMRKELVKWEKAETKLKEYDLETDWYRLVGSGSRNDGRWYVGFQDSWSRELKMFRPILWNSVENQLDIRYHTREICSELDQSNVIKSQVLQMHEDIFKAALVSTCDGERNPQKRHMWNGGLWCTWISQGLFFAESCRQTHR